jgi:hypothetical protein
MKEDKKIYKHLYKRNTGKINQNLNRLVVYKGKLGKALKKKSVYKERGMRKE